MLKIQPWHLDVYRPCDVQSPECSGSSQVILYYGTPEAGGIAIGCRNCVMTLVIQQFNDLEGRVEKLEERMRAAEKTLGTLARTVAPFKHIGDVETTRSNYEEK